MAKTAVADIIIPTEFEKYAVERTATLSAFVQSGIIEMAPEFDALADCTASSRMRWSRRRASASSRACA